MVVLGLLMAQNNFSQNAARDLAKGEGDALLAINRLQQNLIDLEAGQRGYILTGDAAYLEPYQRARRELDRNLSDVRIAMVGRDSGVSDADLTRMEQFAREQLLETDRAVNMARAGEFGVAGDIVRSNLGKRDMDKLRVQLAKMAVSQSERREDAFVHADAVSGRLLPLILSLWALIALLGWAAIRGERLRAENLIEAERAETMREARDRAQLLAGEMNHRIKNLFAVVLSIIQLSSRRDGNPREILADVTARVHALSQAHEAALGSESREADLHQLAERVVAPYRDGRREAFTIAGPDLLLPQGKVTPMALILHELSTNAAKYGALASETGTVSLTWTCELDEEDRQRVRLVWSESGGAPPPPEASQPGKGFGTRMTTMAAAQLGGKLERQWPATGARVSLDFPL